MVDGWARQMSNDERMREMSGLDRVSPYRFWWVGGVASFGHPCRSWVLRARDGSRSLGLARSRLIQVNPSDPSAEGGVRAEFGIGGQEGGKGAGNRMGRAGNHAHSGQWTIGGGPSPLDWANGCWPFGPRAAEPFVTTQVTGCYDRCYDLYASMWLMMNDVTGVTTYFTPGMVRRHLNVE
jgi:hypothetical protein